MSSQQIVVLSGLHGCSLRPYTAANESGDGGSRGGESGQCQRYS